MATVQKPTPEVNRFLALRFPNIPESPSEATLQSRAAEQLGQIGVTPVDCLGIPLLKEVREARTLTTTSRERLTSTKTASSSSRWEFPASAIKSLHSTASR